MTDPTARILRYEIPVDDQAHRLTLVGPIVAWGCRHPYLVELWAWSGRPGDTYEVHAFQVYGTGHPIPFSVGGREHRATVVTPGGRLVWHVLEITE